ncbi:MAG: PxKF domain-containing protein, partial [Actinomycetota bacterium]
DVVVDLTDPTIVEASRLPVANADGWNNAAVTVIWDCADALSGATADSDSDTVSGEGAGQTADGSCSDVAGNSASASRDGINIDTTAPSASASATANGSPYTAGTWTKYDVVVTFGCTDALSGVGSVTDPATLGEGADQSASGTCTDKAGNSAGASFDDIDVDKTAPVASASAKTADDVTYAGGSWTNQSVTVTFDCTDALSGVASLTPPSSTLGDDGADQLASSDCVDNAGNSANASFGDIDIDKTVPVIAFVSRLPAANPAGWNNGAVTVTWNCTDGLSGPVSGSVSDTRSGEGAGQTANGICEDLAGNSAGDSVGDITIDLTDPYGISWLGGPLTGSSYYFGSVPAAPTCSAFDDLSGLASCGVTGYSAAVGSHTMTATALDVAGNDAMAQRSYNVLAWTLRGFYQPVDMNGVWNTVKNGSTVPLKWEMFAGITELTDTSLVALDAKQLSCSGGIGEDAVELTATGATSLRYDETGGQFIYNWQTPKKPGTCYRVTMTADDGSTLSALFKLK